MQGKFNLEINIEQLDLNIEQLIKNTDQLDREKSYSSVSHPFPNKEKKNNPNRT